MDKGPNAALLVVKIRIIPSTKPCIFLSTATAEREEG
jgi:hypothetical protein